MIATQLRLQGPDSQWKVHVFLSTMQRSAWDIADDVRSILFCYFQLHMPHAEYEDHSIHIEDHRTGVVATYICLHNVQKNEAVLS